MSQATKAKLENEILLAALERLEAAAQNKKQSDKELTEAIDAIIEPVLSAIIAYRDCSPLRKFSKILRNQIPKKQNQICLEIQDYLHNYLNIPKNVILYITALNEFSCNIKRIITWSQDVNYKDLIESMPLSVWIDNKKKEKKAKNKPLPYENVKKASKKLISLIESYGLHIDDDSWNEVYNLIKTIIK